MRHALAWSKLGSIDVWLQGMGTCGGQNPDIDCEDPSIDKLIVFNKCGLNMVELLWSQFNV